MDDEIPSLPAGQPSHQSDKDQSAQDQQPPSETDAERFDRLNKIFFRLFKSPIPRLPLPKPPPRLFISLREIGLMETVVSAQEAKFFREFAEWTAKVYGRDDGKSTSQSSTKSSTQSQATREPQTYSLVEFSDQRIFASPDRPLTLVRHLLDYIMDHCEYSCHYAAAVDLTELRDYIDQLSPLQLCNNAKEWVNDKKPGSFLHSEDPDYKEPVESRRLSGAVDRIAAAERRAAARRDRAAKRRELRAMLAKAQGWSVASGEASGTASGEGSQAASGAESEKTTKQDRYSITREWRFDKRSQDWWFGTASEMVHMLWDGAEPAKSKEEMDRASQEKRARVAARERQRAAKRESQAKEEIEAESRKTVEALAERSRRDDDIKEILTLTRKDGETSSISPNATSSPLAASVASQYEPIDWNAALADKSRETGDNAVNVSALSWSERRKLRWRNQHDGHRKKPLKNRGRMHVQSQENAIRQRVESYHAEAERLERLLRDYESGVFASVNRSKLASNSTSVTTSNSTSKQAENLAKMSGETNTTGAPVSTPAQPTRIAVSGGRDFKDETFVRKSLDLFRRYLASSGVEKFELAHGDAKGVDYFAKQWALSEAIEQVPFPSRWLEHGRSAGPVRNREMLTSGVSCLVAFPGGKGTENAVSTAKSLGIKVYRVGVSIDGMPEFSPPIK